MKKQSKLLALILLACIFFFSGTAISATLQRIVIPYTVIKTNWWTGLAIHNESESSATYHIIFIDENGQYISGNCFEVPPFCIKKGVIQEFATPLQLNGYYSIHIWNIESPSEPFSATLFMGNNAANEGFGFDTFRSHDFETSALVQCIPIPFEGIIIQ